MDLLLLFEYPTLCGGERSLLTLLPALRNRGFEPRAAGPRQGPLADALRRQLVEIVPLELHDRAGVRRPLAECRFDLAAILAGRRPALVHANSLSMARLSGPVASQLRIPSLGSLRDIVGLGERGVSDLNCHDRLLAVSEAVRDFHIAQGVDPRRARVLHNGVDLTLFCPRPPTGYLHRELDLEETASLIGSIGQIGPRKGLDLLLAAARTVVEAWSSAHFVIVGERYSRKEESLRFERALHAAAEEPPLAGHVHFLGQRNDVHRILPELAVLAHAARQEPLGRVLLEGAACGCAIVATAVGGTLEIFPASGAAARLVAPDHPAALAEAILEVGTQPRLRSQLSTAARRRAEDAFSGEIAAAGLANQYSDVLNSSVPSGG